MCAYTIKQRRHGRQKCAGIKRYTHITSSRYTGYKGLLDIKGLAMNLENISNLRNVFLDIRFGRFVHNLGFFELGS
jgi:hypothetical protein